jgi:hypothetical protein
VAYFSDAIRQTHRRGLLAKRSREIVIIVRGHLKGQKGLKVVYKHDGVDDKGVLGT